MDTIAFLSYGWFLRRCFSCRVPTRERVQHGSFWITDFSDGHQVLGKRTPLHFACDTTPERRGP